MLIYKRVLAVVELTAMDEPVARRALQVARLCGATLALAHRIDYTPGLEAEHVPALTPVQVEQSLIRAAHARLGTLLSRLGAPEAERHVIGRLARRGMADLAREWGADLIVLSSGLPYGRGGRNGLKALKGTGGGQWDVLTVQWQGSVIRQRFEQALGPLFTAWLGRTA